MEILSSQLTETHDGETKNADFAEAASTKPKTRADIQAWIFTYLTNVLKISPNDIDITIPFDCYSLDSAAAIGFSGDIEQWLGCQFEPTLLYDYPTIEALTNYLNELLFIKQ